MSNVHALTSEREPAYVIAVTVTPGCGELSKVRRRVTRVPASAECYLDLADGAEQVLTRSR